MNIYIANNYSQLLHFCPELPRLILTIKDHFLFPASLDTGQ